MFDVIVIGVGALGAATCWQLARRGARVLGLEQYDLAHGLGSSGGESRLIRLAYYEHPDYVPLLKRAYALWDEIESESGARLRYETGGLYLGRAHEPFVAESRRAAELHGLAHELLDRDALATRFPQFAVPADHVGFFEPAAGVLRAEPAVEAFARAAERGGAELRFRERVLDWDASGAGVTVRTDRALHRAARLVTAVTRSGHRHRGRLDGAHRARPRHPARGDAPGDGLGRAAEPERFAPDVFPAWAIQNGDGSLHYGMPLLPDVRGLKIAHHHAGPATDPDRVDRTPDARDEDDFRPALRRLLPAADGPLVAMHVCLYTTSPDSHFVIGRHPRHENVSARVRHERTRLQVRAGDRRGARGSRDARQDGAADRFPLAAPLCRFSNWVRFVDSARSVAVRPRERARARPGALRAVPLAKEVTHETVHPDFHPRHFDRSGVAHDWLRKHDACAAARVVGRRRRRRSRRCHRRPHDRPCRYGRSDWRRSRRDGRLSLREVEAARLVGSGPLEAFEVDVRLVGVRHHDLFLAGGRLVLVEVVPRAVRRARDAAEAEREVVGVGHVLQGFFVGDEVAASPGASATGRRSASRRW